MSVVAGLLILAVGNPSRGDDALGPLLLERLAAMREPHDDWNDIELLTDFQLQIEHAVDLENRTLVLFVDASVSCPPPFQFTRPHPARDTSYTSHALSPAAVLYVHQLINRAPPPPAFQLAIRGERFELGEPLTVAAETHLVLALDFIGQLLTRREASIWERFLAPAEQ
ncbi:MAG: hydrogenase maturation protease [Candidatus Competibacter sp.]|nr:hydrogenase maturation protease [Candidatus Competibacter sp.]MDG4584525.1 hydrogenase maturation protease [Candidatus Competibacter sp.]